MKKCLNSRGTTMVEVIVSFTIMLLLIAILGGAIAFSTQLTAKAMQLHTDAGEFSAALRSNTKPPKDEGDGHYEFTVVGAGDTATTLFMIKTNLISQTVETAPSSGKEHTFFLFEPFVKGGDAP